jgi:hypothetical protein
MATSGGKPGAYPGACHQPHARPEDRPQHAYEHPSKHAAVERAPVGGLLRPLRGQCDAHSVERATGAVSTVDACRAADDEFAGVGKGWSDQP